MKIYLDLLIIINFIYDFIILLGVNCLLKNKTSIIRIIFSSLIGESTLITLFMPISNVSLLLIKLLVSVIMILIAFSYKNINYFKKNFIYFYLLSIILGGITYFFKISIMDNYNDLILNIIVLLFIIPYFIYKYIIDNLTYKSNINLYHNVDVYIDRKKYSYKGYIDTGNTLKDQYKNRSIILLNDNNIDFNYNNSILVPYKTISESSFLKCRKIDKVIIDNNITIKNVLIAQTHEKLKEEYDCILPNEIKNIF